MEMTYRTLRDKLNKFTDEQLDCDVSVMTLDEEFHGIHKDISFTNKKDEDDLSVGILDEGHPWLCVFGHKG
jgi:hypothetical protein